MSRGRWARAAWWAIATVLACAGLIGSFTVTGDGDSDRLLPPVTLLLYLGVLLALAALSYAVHRTLLHEAPGDAGRGAAFDATLTGVFAAPTLYLAAVFVALIHDCTTGPGC